MLFLRVCGRKESNGEIGEAERERIPKGMGFLVFEVGSRN